MKLSALFLNVFFFVFVFQVDYTNAQSFDCNDTIFHKVYKNQTARIVCDSMYIVTNRTMLNYYFTKEQFNATKNRYDKLVFDLEEKNKIMDKIINENKTYIQKLDTIILEKSKQLSVSQDLVQRSVDNSDKAIAIAKTNRTIALVSVAGTALVIIISIFK